MSFPVSTAADMLGQSIQGAIGVAVEGALLHPGPWGERPGAGVALLPVRLAQDSVGRNAPPRPGEDAKRRAPLLLELDLLLLFIGDDGVHEPLRMAEAVLRLLHGAPMLTVPGAGEVRVIPVDVPLRELADYAAQAGAPGRLALLYRLSPLAIAPETAPRPPLG